METSPVSLEKAHTPFSHALTPSDIRTGSASGRTQPGYESHGGSFRPERRKVRTQRSEFQGNSAGWRRGRTAGQPTCPGQGQTRRSLCRTRGAYLGNLRGGGVGFLAPSCHYRVSYHISLAQEIASASILHATA